MQAFVRDNVVISLDQALSGRSVATINEARSGGEILLGMPHLAGNGLSENWLLKELGHRHWLLLAELAGMAIPRFCDRRGNTVYAVFCAVSIEDADFRRAEENSMLKITSSLARISHTQIESRHHLSVDGAAIGIVTMVSTFVRRSAGDNHAITRAAVDGLPSVEYMVAPSCLASLAAEFRAGRVDSHMGFDLRIEKEVCSLPFDPCPSVDFNGAGFMYFANFVAMIDRAEWRLDRDAATQAATGDRQVFFYGNIVRNEMIDVRLYGWRREANQITHHFRMTRGSDGLPVADVFSRRTLAD